MFDVHFHWYPADLLQRAREANPQNVMLNPPYEKIDQSLATMDTYGIETSLIGYGAFRDYVAAAAAPDLAQGCRVLNERAAELRVRYPGRFLQVAAVDVMAGEEAVPELEKAVKQCGCSALEMLNCYPKDDDTIFPHDKLFWPLYRKAEEMNLPVFVHPVFPPFWKKLPAVLQHMINDWGFLLGNQFAINLMASAGTFDAFPRLNFIFCQLGGFTPFTLGRTDVGYAVNQRLHNRKTSSPDIKLVRLRDYAGRFFVDTHSMDSIAIRCAVDAFGAERILFATDYPIAPPEVGARWHLEQVGGAGLGEVATRAITWSNAEALFKL